MATPVPADAAGVKVAIAGAGIGGLTLALTCRQAGLDVAIYEKVQAPAEVGAGLQISPNGAKVLHRLGLAAALDAVAFRPRAAQLRLARSGALVLETPLGDFMEKRYGAPWYEVHRADLHAVLLSAVRERCGDDAVHTGRELVSFAQERDGVRLGFADGGTEAADVLVGADGIHSKTRELLFGADRPQFTGHVAWRGVVPAERLVDLDLAPVVTSWMAPRSHAVTYFVRRGELVNFVGIREHPAALAESWTGEGDTSDLLADLDAWHPTVRRIAGEIDKPLKWGLFVRAPMPAWSRGRVTLLGDACHAMLPYMAQGAVMAMEDAWVLAACLGRLADAGAALQRYEALRLARTSRVKRLARRNGDLFHLSGPLRPLVFGAMAVGSRLAPGVVTARHDWIMGYDVDDAA